MTRDDIHDVVEATGTLQAVTPVQVGTQVDVEQARRSAGLSTTFLVLQAQRDLAAAQTAALRALLDYRTALVDFELVQQVAVCPALPRTAHYPPAHTEVCALRRAHALACAAL